MSGVCASRGHVGARRQRYGDLSRTPGRPARACRIFQANHSAPEAHHTAGGTSPSRRSLLTLGRVVRAWRTCVAQAQLCPVCPFYRLLQLPLGLSPPHSSFAPTLWLFSFFLSLYISGHSMSFSIGPICAATGSFGSKLISAHSYVLCCALHHILLLFDLSDDDTPISLFTCFLSTSDNPRHLRVCPCPTFLSFYSESFHALNGK